MRSAMQQVPRAILGSIHNEVAFVTANPLVWVHVRSELLPEVVDCIMSETVYVRQERPRF